MVSEEIIDPFAERQAEATEERKLQAVRQQGREAAILNGRIAGEQEANRRGEHGLEREQRLARSMRYAAWEYDGKPLGRSEEYDREFGVLAQGIGNGVTRGGADPKGGKK